MKIAALKRQLVALILFQLGCLGSILHAQSCCGDHTSNQFATTEIQNVTYAENLLNYNGSLSNGVARIWKGTDNDCPLKPLLVLIHGGGFIAGTPNLMDSLAVDFAKKGYLSASISYRLGWIGEGYCSYDSTEAIRAWYRGIQDCNSAIRYFKNNAEALGIDTSLIFLAGWSAGAYIANGTGFMNEVNEKPIQCSEMPPITFNSMNFTRPDLGIINSNGGFHKINAIASFSSSFLFPEIIPSGNKPEIIAFNNSLDPYSIPISGFDSWYSIDDCAETFPKSHGFSNPEIHVNNPNFNPLHIIFESSICPHNLHDPCFPFWDQEVQALAEFFQDKMACNPLNLDPEFQLQSKKNCVITSSDEFMAHTDSFESIIIRDVSGKVLFPSKMKDRIIPGTYYMMNKKNNSNQLLIIVN